MIHHPRRRRRSRRRHETPHPEYAAFSLARHPATMLPSQPMP